MFCFNEAPNRAEIPQFLWVLGGGCSDSGVQPISSWMWFVFSVPPRPHRGWGKHKPAWGSASLCAGSGSPQVVFPWDLPPSPVPLHHQPTPFLQPQGWIRGEGDKTTAGTRLQKAWALLLSEVSTAWFIFPLPKLQPDRENISTQGKQHPAKGAVQCSHRKI